MNIPNGEFEVGITEKHKITFKTSRWFWSVDILVDSVPTVVKNIQMLCGPFTLEVGEKEKHTVMIQYLVPNSFFYLRGIPVQVFVDGKLYKTF